MFSQSTESLIRCAALFVPSNLRTTSIPTERPELCTRRGDVCPACSRLDVGREPTEKKMSNCANGLANATSYSKHLDFRYGRRQSEQEITGGIYQGELAAIAPRKCRCGKCGGLAVVYYLRCGCVRIETANHIDLCASPDFGAIVTTVANCQQQHAVDLPKWSIA